MKTTKHYTNQYGVKTSYKLDAIIKSATDYVNNGNSTFEKKNGTKKMETLRRRFEQEAKAIGGLIYNFSDCIA